MSSGLNFNLSAKSPEDMRELFEKCMAEVNTLCYDGKLILDPGAANIYVFGEDCPDCGGFGWIGGMENTCETCKGRKQIGPAWVMP